MNEQNPMEALLQRYKEGHWERRALEQQLIIHLMNHPHRFNLRHLNPDDRMDFLCFYFPRLRKAIDNYKVTGHSFDAYIHRSIQFALRDYKHEETIQHEEEAQIWHFTDDLCQPIQKEQFVQDYDQPYSEDAPVRIRNPKQILLLTLKAYRYISPDFSNKVANAIGLEPKTIEGWIREIRMKRLADDMEIEKLQAATCYIKKLRFEQQLLSIDSDSMSRTRLEWQAAKNIQHLEKLNRKLRKIKKTASNQLIADVLGMPKGTVDANLHALKQKRKDQETQRN